MPRFALCLLLTLFLPLTSMASVAADIRHPARGTAERKEILNSIRPILEARVGKPVEFVVSWLRVYKEWAWVSVDPQRPGGGAINPGSPTYRMWEGQDGLGTYVLLKHAYGRWNVVDFAIGPTDVFWQGDPLYEQFPKAFTFPR